jgi:fumarylpyruvate hydrolase
MMIWKIPEQIAILSKFYDISAGDLIMTGTPAGVGPIVKGDKLVGTIDGLETLSVEVI